MTEQAFLSSLIFLSEDMPYFLGWISFYSMTLKISSLSVCWEKMIFAFLIEVYYHICRKNKYHLYQIYRKYLFLSFSKRWYFIFCMKKRIMFLGKRNTIFLDSTRSFFGKTIFSEHLQKISYFNVFFCDRSCFIFRLPGNTGKIIFQSSFIVRPALKNI